MSLGQGRKLGGRSSHEAARVLSMKAVTEIELPKHTHAGPQGEGGSRATCRWMTRLDDTLVRTALRLKDFQ